jgi:hypothetical protein
MNSSTPSDGPISSGITPLTEIQDYDASNSTMPSAKPTSEEIARKEWKYTGYRGFCDFVSSDDDFFVIRRFGALSARVILALQDQLSALESDLLTIDRQLSSKDCLDVHNGSFRRDRDTERWLLIQQIHSMLKEYSKSRKFNDGSG